MKRVHILVEGNTEELFVRDVLRPHLWENHEVDLNPVIVNTKIFKSGPNFKGGLSKYPKVKKDLLRLLGDTNVSAVTTLFDYYGLPDDFPGFASLPNGRYQDQVQHLEWELEGDIDAAKFKAYLSVHEYEAVAFVSPFETARALLARGKEPEIRKVRTAFGCPEAINHGPTTTPSKRLLNVFPSYVKTFHGPLIASRIGLAVIRADCPHLNGWLTWLELLGNAGV